ncbi:MAG: flavodoxin family protein [Euryarchaeota archaeon]|nr:flavodoxin family protein [Euryarchaeota archaeon]
MFEEKMNILVINGSPKAESSNSMRLTRAFLDGAGYDAEIINAAKLGIRPCLGCFACWNKQPGQCVINDKMSEVLQKIIAADVIVWSFPLYYFSIPGALKNLIDRQLPLALPFMSDKNSSGGHPPRYDLSRQRHIVISTCGFWTSEGNYDGVTAMFDHIYGVGNYTKIFCGQGELFRVSELRNRTDAYLEIVRRAGVEFATGEVMPETQRELAEPLYPRDVFEKMADASWEVFETGEVARSDDGFGFTKQMAALYRPDGKERVIEFAYTDIDKVYQIVCQQSGHSVIRENFMPYTTRIETSYAVWRAIARGEISGQDALFEKKYRVLGDFNLMLRWDELFGVTKSTPRLKDQAKNLKTNMAVLLAPWMVIWIALAIDPFIGGILGILTSATIPLIWLICKPTLFEHISIFMVAMISLLALVGADLRLVVPLSYGLFGLMWFITTFYKIPLTAYYSQNSYGGDKALDNPLFMRTNRILTACWGVLFLVTSFWTYWLMTTAVSPYVGLINSVSPVIMGVFTVWFQKWYPSKWARG